MDFENFDSLIVALKKNVIEFANSEQEHMNKIETMYGGRADNVSPIKDAIIKDQSQILDSDFSSISKCFKDAIVDFFNLYYDNFYRDFSIYVLFRDALLSHTQIKYQYYTLKTNFGYKDSDKYVLQNNRYIKNYKIGKIKFYVEPRLSPYDQLKFFAVKMKEQMHLEESFCVPTKGRDKEKYKMDLINRLMKIILCDCPIYLNQLKEKIRITELNKQNYKDVQEEYKNTLNTKSPIQVIKP